MALHFCLRHAYVSSTLTGMSTPEEGKKNLGALCLQIGESLFGRGRSHSGASVQHSLGHRDGRKIATETGRTAAMNGPGPERNLLVSVTSALSFDEGERPLRRSQAVLSLFLLPFFGATIRFLDFAFNRGGLSIPPG